MNWNETKCLHWILVRNLPLTLHPTGENVNEELNQPLLFWLDRRKCSRLNLNWFNYFISWQELARLCMCSMWAVKVKMCICLFDQYSENRANKKIVYVEKSDHSNVFRIFLERIILNFFYFTHLFRLMISKLFSRLSKPCLHMCKANIDIPTVERWILLRKNPIEWENHTDTNGFKCHIDYDCKLRNRRICLVTYLWRHTLIMTIAWK